MDFRVYIVIEMPILEKKYELLVPIDRRIHDVINVLVKNIPQLTNNYYQNKKPSIYNKSTGEVYDMNTVIKNSNIKMGSRLVLI